MCIWAIFNRWDGSLIHKIALRNRVHKEHTPPMQKLAHIFINRQIVTIVIIFC